VQHAHQWATDADARPTYADSTRASSVFML
jgi:hypothetical protein